MDVTTLNIDDIAELPAPLAIAGSIRAAAAPGDGMFEAVIDIAVLIYEMFPNG